MDDIIITGNNEEHISNVKAALQTQFDMKDLGDLHFFLGLEIKYCSNGIFVSQHKYAKDLLYKSGMGSCHTQVTPCQVGHKLLKDSGSPLSSSDATYFRSLVGCLQYLTFTRPDIAYSVNSICQFLQSPTEDHLIAAKRILRYVKGTMNLGLFYSKNTSLADVLQTDIQAFCDADWAGDPNDRKSTTGFVVLVNNAPISWCSKKQHAVSRSSTEAEYRSMADATSEIQWLITLLKDLGIQLAHTPVLLCDNVSALALASNPVHHSKLKHVEVDVHFTREKVKAGTLQVQFVPTHDQLADIFTKGLCLPQHDHFCSSLMVVSPPSS